MKKLVFVLIILSVLFLLSLASYLASACFNPTDSFASEVVLNKPGIQYNLGLFLKGRNFIHENNQYIFQSQYSRDLAVILTEPTEVCENNCLSIRLQTPVENVNERFPYFSIISSVYGKINLLDETHYRGWQIFYSQKLIEFRKDKISMLVISAGSKHDVVIEINEELEDCLECDGKCISSSYGNGCIPKDMVDDIEDLLKYVGLIENFKELFTSYRVVGGERTLSDLKSIIKTNIDWEEAMRQELVWLKKQGVISIQDRDIESIVELSDSGKSGHNSRIIYNTDKEKWDYYYETENPIMLKEINCEEFPISKVPKKELDFKKKIISPYYSIPIIIALILFLFLFILSLLGRYIYKRKKERKVERGRKKGVKKKRVK